MKIETENEINAHVRRVYEPRYGRSLSDDEVYEIRHNLRSFAEGIVSIAERLHGRPDNLPEDEDQALEKLEQRRGGRNTRYGT